MKIVLISLLKFGLKILYAPMKLFKTKNQIVYLSRQSNSKSVDMTLLEKQIKSEDPSIKQVFRLKMIDEGLSAKIKYAFSAIGDMYFLATSKVAIVDTYSITVSCLKHKESLKVIQMWHALGAIKKFGYSSFGTKEGRDMKVSKAMNMHQNYDYVLAPSPATAKFYMEGFNCSADKIKICSLPRVDYILDNNNVSQRFFKENPAFTGKKVVLYLPTFREREVYIANQLKLEFKDDEDFRLIVSHHPLSNIKVEDEFSYYGNYSTYDLMKVADIIISDYSASAFEGSVLMKALYFYVPDFDQYNIERGININLREEFSHATFEDASELMTAIKADDYDYSALYNFKEKYVSNTNNCTETLAKFICMLTK